MSEIFHKLDYIRSTLNELRHQRVVHISRVAAIREILRTVPNNTDSPPPNSSTDSKRKRSSSLSDGEFFQQKGSSSSSEEEEFEPVRKKKVGPASKTFLTPNVNRIAKDLFKGSLEVAKFNHYGEDHNIVSTKQRRHQVHRANPAKIIWGERLAEDGPEMYSSVLVDGVTYQVKFSTLISSLQDTHLQVGDIVMVEPDGDDQTNTSEASQTVNKYGNRWW